MKDYINKFKNDFKSFHLFLVSSWFCGYLKLELGR